jgi:kynurenine aminotransferase
MNYGMILGSDFVNLSHLDMCRRAVTPRTKMIIVNTPHNPVGKVFTKAELESIASIAEEFNLMVMADEVVSCHSPFL